MTTPELSPQAAQSIKAKSWITLGGAAIISVIPFIGLIMWLLFLPVVILVGMWGYRLIGMGDTKGGVIHLGAAFLFVPFAFVAPLVTSSLMSALIWPPTPGKTATASNSAANGPDSLGVTHRSNAATSDMGSTPVAKKTIEFWKKLREFEIVANSSQKDDMRKYPQSESGQYDFTQFKKDDFEILTKFHFAAGEIKRQVAIDIGNLPVLEVDQDLIRFKIELCDHWNAASQMSMGFAALVNSLHEQRIHFTSEEAYKLRFAKGLMGQSDMEAAYQQNQREIDSRVEAWKVIVSRDAKLRDQLMKSEQEVKALLTSRYNWEFQ